MGLEMRGLHHLTLHAKREGGRVLARLRGTFGLFKKTKRNFLNWYFLLSPRYFAAFTLVLTAPRKGDTLSPTRAPLHKEPALPTSPGAQVACQDLNPCLPSSAVSSFLWFSLLHFCKHFVFLLISFPQSKAELVSLSPET